MVAFGAVGSLSMASVASCNCCLADTQLSQQWLLFESYDSISVTRGLSLGCVSHWVMCSHDQGMSQLSHSRCFLTSLPFEPVFCVCFLCLCSPVVFLQKRARMCVEDDSPVAAAGAAVAVAAAAVAAAVVAHKSGFHTIRNHQSWGRTGQPLLI